MGWLVTEVELGVGCDFRPKAAVFSAFRQRLKARLFPEELDILLFHGRPISPYAGRFRFGGLFDDVEYGDFGLRFIVCSDVLGRPLPEEKPELEVEKSWL